MNVDVRPATVLDDIRTMGVTDVRILDYRDGELARASVPGAVERIAHHPRRVRPQVVVTVDRFAATTPNWPATRAWRSCRRRSTGPSGPASPSTGR